MIPAAVDYVRATSLEDALAALETEDAKVLAGGQSLLPAMKLRLARPALSSTSAGSASTRSSTDNGDARDRRACDLGLARGARGIRAAGADRDLGVRVRRSATFRSATSARSAARWRTPTRPPTCQR